GDHGHPKVLPSFEPCPILNPSRPSFIDATPDDLNPFDSLEGEKMSNEMTLPTSRRNTTRSRPPGF
ncbi:MAG: hypothetical protein WCF65_09555, partial [Parachlamydiaceae bacterium]